MNHQTYFQTLLNQAQELLETVDLAEPEFLDSDPELREKIRQAGDALESLIGE